MPTIHAMRAYANKVMAELAAELGAGLVRLRKGYIDSAEALLEVLVDTREYPYEFIVFRLTGYHPGNNGLPDSLLSGASLKRDLPALILDLCDSFELASTDYDEPLHDLDALTRRFNVSGKTIQRWRDRGLVARRLLFPDGKRRVAFLESSVRRFVAARSQEINRSSQFTQMTAEEKDAVIRRARRMVDSAGARLSDVARRLAAHTGRAVETIRYTLRRHDIENPEQAIFPHLLSQIDEEEKASIYRAFLRGVSVQSLAQRCRRTRGSIYRIVNEMRAQQLMSRPITYIHNPEFDLPNASDAILNDPAAEWPPRAGAKPPKPPVGLPAYLQALYEMPLLNPEAERALFRKYNYLKYRSDKLRQEIDPAHVRTGKLKQIEKCLVQANVVKNQIIRANLRLVVSIAKKHVGGVQTLFELISDGNVSLMKAVEKFDYSRGNRFSTYASWAIIRNFARSVPRERYVMDRYSTGHEEVLDIAAGLRTYDSAEVSLSELRESIDSVLAQLSSMERSILVDHYGLDQGQPHKTLEQLGRSLGISKERVRQIEIQALSKLRDILHPQQADLMS
ncbi:MAG: sigma-70 family RNA polymerase sigma factor [Planctomycetota bacterium]|nr:sigma-70 family RNA polymerase sigma factor [Planctomycetota bacterium]